MVGRVMVITALVASCAQKSDRLAWSCKLYPLLLLGGLCGAVMRWVSCCVVLLLCFSDGVGSCCVVKITVVQCTDGPDFVELCTIAGGVASSDGLGGTRVHV